MVGFYSIYRLETDLRGQGWKQGAAKRLLSSSRPEMRGEEQGWGNGHGEKCSVFESLLKVGPTA